MLVGNDVVAVTGSAEKQLRLEDLGCGQVINYRSEDLDQALQRAAPQGFDLILETVGGDVFDTALRHIADRGRLVVSGFTSDADNPKPVTRPRIYTELYWRAARS